MSGPARHRASPVRGASAVRGASPVRGAPAARGVPLNRIPTAPYVQPDPTLEAPPGAIADLERSIAAATEPYERIALLIQLVRAWRGIDVSRVTRYARLLLRTARATGDADALCWALITATRAAVAIPNMRRAWRFLDEARSLSDHCTSLVCVAQIYHYRGIVFDYEFDTVRAFQELTLARGLAERSGHPTVLAYVLCTIVGVERQLGRPAAGLALLHEALELARAGEDRELEIWIIGALGRAASDLEDTATALEYLGEAIERSEQLGLARALFRSRLHYATVLAQLGRFDEALEIERAALPDEHLATLRERTAFRAAMSQHCERVGRFDEAAEHVDAALAMFAEGGVPPSIDALVVRATVTLGLGDGAGAIAELERAIDEARRREEPLGVFFALEALAQMHEKLGNHAEALRCGKEYAALREQFTGAEAQREAARITMQAELDRAEREQERARVEAEVLERQLAERDRELAAASVQVGEASELLESILREMRELASVSDPAARRSVRAIVRRVEGNRDSGSYWSRFDEQFERAHAGFTDELARRFPALTAMELRLCALLKLATPTKEIATLLGTSADNIEVYRYRIRKKLGLDRTTTFAQFFAEIGRLEPPVQPVRF